MVLSDYNEKLLLVKYNKCLEFESIFNSSEKLVQGSIKWQRVDKSSGKVKKISKNTFNIRQCYIIWV